MGVLTEVNDAARRMAPVTKGRHMPAARPEESLTFGRFDGKAVPDGQNLQDAFTRFRSERSRQVGAPRLPASELKRRAAARRAADPAGDKAALREKFLARAKNYIGTPYAERYHAPGDALYGKPLYLDCSNFIRRVVQDLRADFGFDLGNWNQSYQFATLPDAIAYEDRKPGDLMFVEATYRTGRHKQQKLNIVHVEIYAGETHGAGVDSTLGSRNRWGCVEVLDSYTFDSTFYDITNVFWRSIDPWLEGRCDPWTLREAFGSHDPYGDSVATVGKKSIFAADDEEEGAEEEDPETGAPDEARPTLVDLLRDAGSVAAIGAFFSYRDVGTLHALSNGTRATLESDETAPALWHAACAALGGEKGLFLPAAPAAAPGADGKNASRRAAMAWKRLFFDALWPSRFKWAAEKKATKRDFKIEVCVRFRPEAAEENVAAGDADVTLPLHQYLAVQRQRRAEAPSVERHLVGGADVPANLRDAVTGAALSSPVRLPSGAVVERKWAERHVARRGTDPYDGSAWPPGAPLEGAGDVKEKILAFRAENGADGDAVKVAGSEVVSRLAGKKVLDPTVLDAVLEAERLAASAAAAREAAERQRLRLGEEVDEEVDDAAAATGAAAPEEVQVASATSLTAGLESAEAQVAELEKEAEAEEEPVVRPRSGAKVLAVQPTRVVVHVPGAGVRPFPFSRVFEDGGQSTVYASVGAPAVNAALNGMNACVLCYGQTGSGKTYSAFGPPGALESGSPDDESAGLVARAVAELLSASAEGTDVRVAMQYVEIYNESCVDLLTGLECDVRRDSGEPVGCVEAPLASLDDAVRLLRAGSVRKRFAATKMNARSSRAHAVVLLRVRQARGEALLESRLLLVDLAGSERIYRSGAIHDAKRRGEAVAINGSLLVLGKVIAALVEGRSHVPYLEAKLATLLRSALGGASRTTALVCCRRSADHGDETLQALRFGKRCALVSNLAEQVAASSASEALATIDATVADCAAAMEDLAARGHAKLATYRTLDDRLKQMRARRRAITDIVRAEARDAAEGGAP